MNEKISNWMKQSETDFIAAKYNFEGKMYYVCAFLCQQSVEKALKGLFLYEKKGLVPQSHSLIYLATNTSVPQKFYSFLKELTPKFIDTRYPDASVDLPSNIYDKENTLKLLKKSEEVLKWIKKSLLK